jgi:FHA domain-containing protein/type VI secretion system protein
MSLTLRVQTYRKQAPAMPVERRFDQLGGTIGRAAGNDLELPDPGKYISRNHSKIDFADGRYTLMDLGANPSWINDRPVGAGKVAGLEHGDRLMIGDYVLEVLVEQPSGAVVPVFSTETSDALPFQAQPLSAADAAPPQFEPVADTLAGMKVLDVAGHFEGLAAPSANDPLGLGLQGEPQVPTQQQIAAYRGSESDHAAPQFMPMHGGLMPGRQPGIATPDGAQQQPYVHPPQAAAQQPWTAPSHATGAPGAPAAQDWTAQQPAAGTPATPATQAWPAQQQAAGAHGIPASQGWPEQPPAAGAPGAPVAQTWPAPFPAAGASQAWPAAFPAGGGPQAAAGQAMSYPAAGSPLPSPLAPSPYAAEPTVLVMRTPTAAPTAPPPPAVFIPDDYDPLADLAPPRMPASAPQAGWPQPATAVAPPQGGWPAPQALMQTMSGIPPAAGMPAAPGAMYPGQPQPGLHAGGHPGMGWPSAPGVLQHGAQQAWGEPAPQQPLAQPGWPQPAQGVAPGYPYPPQPVAQVMAAGQGDAVLQALLRGMGLSALQLNRGPVETAELAGAMLREAVSGTMAVLMARAMTKRESRLDMTVLGAQANNPLKFFPDAESALAQMLTNAMSGYMPPVKAIGSAYDDLKAHEMAVIAGMRAALKGVMVRFDPAQIEAQEPEGVMDKMMTAARKARMWDNMKALYDDIVREADDDFQHLFGEKFSAAYEDQIGRLHRNP